MELHNLNKQVKMINAKQDELYDSKLSKIKQNFTDSLKNELTCPICLNILKDPIICTKCLKNFCENCVKEWENKNNLYCPFHCFMPEYNSNLSLKNIINLITHYNKEIKSINKKDELNNNQ